MTREEEINKIIQDEKLDTNKISDGYHRFEELYKHRIALHIALCRQLHYHTFADDGGTPVWRTKKHSDGSAWDGWFVLGINFNKGQQITYHLPITYWDEVSFARTLDQAPDFDGHTPNDVLERIGNL